jgi:hypothetical protein
MTHPLSTLRVFCIVIVVSGCVAAQPWSRVMTSPRAIDWSGVGARTIPVRSTVVLGGGQNRAHHLAQLGTDRAARGLDRQSRKVRLP